MGVEIGKTIIFRDVRALVDGAKTLKAKQHFYLHLRQLCELDDLILIEVEKISARKYQLIMIITEDNSIDVTEDKIYLTANWYDIKSLNDAVEVEYENELFGACTELRSLKYERSEK